MKKIFRKNNKLTVILRSEASSGSYQPLDITQNWSDSEHTQSLQTNNVGWDIADLRTDGVLQVRKAKHEVSRSETSANDNAERKANPRDLPNITKLAQTAALTLALSFFIAAPAMAQDPVFTLDNIKEQNTAFINSQHATYTLTALGADEDVPEGAVSLNIGDKTYYYNPEENNKNVLQSLASTGSSALIETTSDKALYTVDGKYYTYDTNKLKGSAYSLKEAASADDPNTITLYDKTEVIKYYDPTTGKEVAADDRQEGVEYKEVTTIQTTPKYYTVSLKQTEYGNKDAAGTVPHYFKWTNESTDLKLETATETEAQIIYWEDQTRTALSRITIDQGGADINNNFIGQSITSSSSVYGGAIYNSGEIGDITSDFIGNYALVPNLSTQSTAQGGAIYNSGEIGDITGDFIGNYVSSNSNVSSFYGGAIYNSREIGDITGDFIGNYVLSSSNTYGGAIYNSGTIGNITGDFIGNYIASSRANGGAFYNDGTIGNIAGDFIGNYASSRAYYPHGGAIYNDGTIGNITGDFISNNASYGGAIYNNNYAHIEDITGNFIGNYASGSYVSGGAICNDPYRYRVAIGNIKGDFIGNYIESTTTSTSSTDQIGGGAIANYTDSFGKASIGDIEGSFINNHVNTVRKSAYGGAIYNYVYSSRSPATIGDITGDFIDNYASSTDNSAYGGAIYNYARSSSLPVTIGDITSDFIGNSASGSYAYGGAIYNSAYSSSAQATIGDITGDFIGNYASGRSNAYGGAIYNRNDTINLTNSNFYNNYVKSEYGTAQGGAIYASGTTNIIADNGQSIFSGNYVEDTNGKRNEAIYAAYFSTNINLTAKNNGTIRFDDTINGASGYNLNITGDGTGTVALYNDVTNAKVTTGNVTVDVANNETRNYNFVSMTAGEDTKLNLDVNFANKTADTITTKNTSTGTLIINAINFLGTADGAVTVQIIKNTDPSSTLQLAFGDNITEVAQDFVFDKNYVEHTDKFIQEGGLSLATTDTVNDSITIDIDKQLDTLQLINSYETDEDRTFQFADSSKYMLSEDLNPTTSGVLNINGISASAPSTLDANSHTLFNLQNETNLNISNVSIEGAKDYAINAENQNATVNLTNTSFKNTDGTAINSNVDINITADGGKSEFTGNTTAIYMNDSSKTINMTAANQGEIVLSDVVDGAQGYSLKLDGDDKSKITVNNNINNANISLDNTNLYLSKETYFDNAQSLSLNSGSMYLNNDAIGTMHVPTLNLNGTTNLSVDVDLANESMDRITADTYNVTKGALLNVTDLNLLSTTEKNSVKILFADEPLANNVEYTGDSPISYKGTNTVYSPIYKYDVQYGVDENDKLGYFFFNRAASGSGSNGNISDAFNPSVLASPVATQAGAYTTQLQTFNYAFQHADTFMNIPYLERVAIINQGKYALSPTGDATDVGTYSPLLLKEESAGFWVKPYASFENVPLKNGPKVSNINYGTLVGYDSPLQSISNGFERVLTGYIGYNGASQRYSGVDAYQNGGLLGGTATFYKGNFFNATTLSVGASAGDASTMYGSENYTMLLAGLGNKTGYNFEFFNGGMILQPSMLISYTFVNTFDYNNAAGVRIESDPMHAIQLAPGIKLIGNTKNGWQPYIGVSMVWNLLDESKVTADSVRLPEMSIKPYVQYGVGLQKRVNDKFLAFGQAMIHNGGRNGVSLSAGLRWKIGRE